MLVAQGCEPKCTEVGVVSTDQLMHSVGEDAFANIQLLKSESNPPEGARINFICTGGINNDFECELAVLVHML